MIGHRLPAARVAVMRAFRKCHQQIQPAAWHHLPRIDVIERLAEMPRPRVIDAAGSPLDLEAPGNRLHELQGDREGVWSVTISGNWRLTFRFTDGNAHDVDLIDYH